MASPPSGSRPTRPAGGARGRAAPPPAPSRPGWLLPVIGGVVVLVLALVAVAVVATRGGHDDSPSASGRELRQQQPVPVRGAALPFFDGDKGTDPAVGMPAPTLEGKGFDGTPMR